MSALVVQDVKLRGFEIAAGRPIARKGIVVVTVPEALHDLHEFRSPVVALTVTDMLIATEIECFRRV
jgi:hypothetical protein